MTLHLAYIFISFTFTAIFKNPLKFMEQLNYVSSEIKHTHTHIKEQ